MSLVKFIHNNNGSKDKNDNLCRLPESIKFKNNNKQSTVLSVNYKITVTLTLLSYFNLPKTVVLN